MSSTSIYGNSSKGKSKPTCSCILCKSEVSVSNIAIHYNSKQCKSGGKQKKTQEIPKDFNCKYCGKECKNLFSLRSHEFQCKSNPNRIPNHLENHTYEKRKEIRNKNPSNQYIKARKLGLPLPTVSDETRNKLSISTTKISNEYWNGNNKEEHRKTHSDLMRKVATENPESYSSSNRGRTKEIEKYGVKFQGSWELKFYEWCIHNQIEILRNFEGFNYTFDGERTYYPDFYLPELDTYVEVKGYKVDRDVAKWSYFPHKLLVIQKYEISLIDKNEYELIY